MGNWKQVARYIMSHRNGDRNNSSIRESDTVTETKNANWRNLWGNPLRPLFVSVGADDCFGVLSNDDEERHAWINGTFLWWIEFSSQSHGNHGGDDDYDDHGDDNHRKCCMTRRLALRARATAVAVTFAVDCCYFPGRCAAISSFARQSCSMQKRTVGKSVTVDVRPIARLSRNDQRAWYIKSPFNGNARFPMNS